jgi:fumarylpyruvate hydrolase
MDYAFTPAPIAALPVVAGKPFPIRRIFCVGRNYADHAREMGSDPVREAPFFFMKPADAILSGSSMLPYPPATADLHHEVEMVVALGHGGANIPLAQATDCIFGYAVGLDMTRRDMQAVAKSKGQPWDMSKGFDHSAPVSAITQKSDSGILSSGSIQLKVNGTIRQSGDLADMIWSVPEVIHQLSQLVQLQAGDLIFTGTPAGVGPVVKGDKLEAEVAGLEILLITVG